MITSLEPPKGMRAEWGLQHNPTKKYLNAYVYELIGEHSKSTAAFLSKVIIKIVVKYLKTNINFFGAAEWQPYGKVPPAPNLRIDIEEMLEQPCSIYPEKTIAETHILTYIPVEIDGRPLTLIHFLMTVIKRCEISRIILKTYGNKAVERPCWILMPKNILPNSGKVTPDVQHKMVVDLAIKSKLFYKFPSILKAFISISMNNLHYNRSLIEEPVLCTYTRCIETVIGNETRPLHWKRLERDNVTGLSHLFVGAHDMDRYGRINYSSCIDLHTEELLVDSVLTDEDELVGVAPMLEVQEESISQKSS